MQTRCLLSLLLFEMNRVFRPKSAHRDDTYIMSGGIVQIHIRVQVQYKFVAFGAVNRQAYTRMYTFYNVKRLPQNMYFSLAFAFCEPKVSVFI